MLPEWQGVTCNPVGYAVNINLQYTGLVGCLPPRMSNVRYLQNINISNNSLFGPLPSFHGMSSLQHINLDENYFGSIAQDFFTCLENVVHISLCNNVLNTSFEG